MAGVGTLPFRGGISPQDPENFVKEYAGIRTTIIQSAFRYDFPKPQVQKAIRFLNLNLPKGKARAISSKDEQKLITAITFFEAPYHQTIEPIASLINQVNAHLPKRRERVQHIGLFGYSRGVGRVRLPRAINFTGSLYSLGVPPELIGTGRGVKKAREAGLSGLVEKYYVNFKQDIKKAGGFLYKPGLIALAKKSAAWRGIWEDVQELENHFLMELGPKTGEQKAHYRLCEQLHKKLNSKSGLTKIIERQAHLRHSLG